MKSLESDAPAAGSKFDPRLSSSRSEASVRVTYEEVR
jgi:hypothetical protein